MTIVLHPNTHTYYLDDKPMRYSVTQFVSKFFPGFPARSIASKLAIKRNVDADSILAEWRQTATDGTKLHEDIHHYLNGLQVNNTSQEFRNFLYFLDDHPTWDMIHSEMLVAHPELKIAGSIDAVFRDHEGKNFLVDWKRTSKQLDAYTHKWAYEPISHIRDNSFNRYSLQLNLYKRLIDYEIEDMFIVRLSPTHFQYHKYQVMPMDREVDLMLSTLASPS